MLFTNTGQREINMREAIGMGTNEGRDDMENFRTEIPGPGQDL